MLGRSRFRSEISRLQIAKEFSKESQDLFKLLDLEDPTLMMNT